MTALALLVAMGATGPQVQWLTALQAKQGIELPAAGNYFIWIWAPTDGSGAVSIDGKSMDVEKPGKPENKYQWYRGGRVEMSAGRHDVKPGDSTAMVAVAASETFNPKAAIGDAYVFEKPTAADDARVDRVRETNTVFTMPEFKSRSEWESLAGRIRKRMLIGSGLLPMPEKTPLNAEITGRIEHRDQYGAYSVEKVKFEARPGLLVTGNLYRPLDKTGPFPGIINPHGHWEQGRLANDERGSVPARCITFARMGIVAFSYDMTGHVDSRQFPHGWGGQREKLWGLHPFAVQLWASVRSVDFMESLPDVDPNRIGCTGASGGGTQTFALTAIDPRIKVSAPVNMISHSMQGGCGCENSPIIRLENSNMEIGAMMAPKPLLMVCATGDWTRETPRVEFPAIQSIYRLYDAPDNVETVQVDSGHNYNKLSREAVYRFMGKHLLGDPEKWAGFTEPPYQLEKVEDLRVFPDGKLPDGLPNKEEIIARIIAATRDKWRAIMPANKDAYEAFRKDYGDALALTMGVTMPQANDLAPERVGYEERRDKGYVVERWVLGRRDAGDRIPAILYRAYDAKAQDAVVLVHGQGKAALADLQNGGPGPLVAALIAQGRAVLAIDAFLLGEHHSPFAMTERKAKGGFPDTFLPTDTGYRVQDVVTSLAWLRARRDMTGKIDLAGLDQGGMWALFAAAVDGRVDKLAVDGCGFDPDDDAAWIEKCYIPCIRSIGDVDTAAAMVAPNPLFVFNAPAALSDGMEAAYTAAGTSSAAAFSASAAGPDELAKWLNK